MKRRLFALPLKPKIQPIADRELTTARQTKTCPIVAVRSGETGGRTDLQKAERGFLGGSLSWSSRLFAAQLIVVVLVPAVLARGVLKRVPETQRKFWFDAFCLQANPPICTPLRDKALRFTEYDGFLNACALF
jgi:hypothetical protein